MPESLTRPLLEGKPLLGDSDPQEQPVDIMAFHRWHTYLDRGDGESRTILALEVEARIRRLVLNHKEGLYEAKILPAGKAEDIAHYLADHYMEEWAVSDAARNAGLHPNYAMAIFRRAFGISMVAYVTQLRVAMAQQLLVSGELDVLQVGFESGFGSTSRFYAAFKAQTGQTPLAYRRALKWGSGDLPREKRGL